MLTFRRVYSSVYTKSYLTYSYYAPDAGMHILSVRIDPECAYLEYA